MSNGQSSSGGIGGGLIPEDGFLGGSLLEEADLLGALPGLTDVIGAGGSQAPSGSGFPNPSLIGLQSPSPLQPPAFPIIPSSGGAGSSAGSSGSSPAQFNSLLSDALTGATQGSLVGNPGVGNFPLSSASAPGSSNATAPGLGFTVKAEGTVTINSNSDFDGDPLDLSDDALIYAGDGFTINGNPVLPVQLDEFGQPVLDNSGRPLLVDNAVAVSADYSIFNANNNTYGNLVPPQIVEEQIVEVPDFNTLKSDTLAAQIPDGTVPISFNPYQNPLNNATDWANHFPPGGTAEQPTVVKVTGWGLNVPGGVTIENTIIELTNGYLNFNGNGHQLNNVTFVTHNGGMNLGNIQGTDVTLLSSQGINMNGGARLGGQSLIATGDNQSIQFNGATETTDPTDFLTVISQRDITFNSSANTRGSFLSRGNFSINSTSTIYGSIETKGNVVFNARATVIGIAPTGPSNTAPTDLALSNTTLPENGAANSVVGQLTTTDPDAGDTFTYTLVPGTGDTDNAAFSIVNDQLQINASPDFEAQDSYAIRVQSTDQGGLSVEKVFTVNITDVNEQPTQIALSQSAVEENSATGTVVGQLSSLDPDQGDSHTYELVDDAGGRFQIVGDQLQVADGTLIDFEAATEYSLTIRSTDAGGLSTTQGLTIQVLDVDDDLQIAAALLQDTGAINTDGITAEGTIQGTVNYPDNVASLKAGLDNTLPIDYEDITPLIQADGSFTLDEAQLSSILGVPLTDGDHILYLQAVDAQGNSTDIVELAFTLDRTRPTVDLLTPIVAGEHSPTARLLGDAQDSVAGVDQIRYDLNGQGFVDITADSTGAFDALLAQTGLAAGAHQLTVEVTDIAGNVTQTQLDFQVNPDLLVGPTNSQGWVARSGDAVVLGEQNSFVSEASLAVELGQDTGSRTLSFDLNAIFDGTDANSLPDQVLVYLVDANDPSQTLLDQGVEGTPVFALGEQGSEFQAGLVRFNGSTVEIDVTSVTATQGLLVFQLINGDSDTGSVIQVSNLTNEVDESGVASPVFPMRRDVAQSGTALDLGGLTGSTDLDVVLSKVSLDTDTGRYVADLQIENTGAAIGRQVAVVFDSLPDGVTLLNASGTDSNGNPYINLNLAIRPGGLLEGGISDAVQVVFDNPNLLNLDLQPQVLVGGVNQAPVLEAITVPQLMPGEVLKLPLQATDPDGDPITYSLRSEGELPTGVLRGDGTLEFRPAPDEIGTYTFTIVASDGALETTQEVTLEVVADPITTTRISGVIANVDQQPLAGVRVEIAGVEGTTAADGSFTLEFVGDLPGDTLKIYPDDINTATEVYPFIAEKLPLVLGHDPYGGVNNVIDRPIYLPVLDIANGQVVDPTQDTTVTTATIPGAAVTVAAGSLLDQQGNPFDGVLSITEVPTEFTPAALPPGLDPELVVTIQPGEMVFDTPAALSLPNLSGYAPGLMMDLWSINPETGDFDKVGVGQVSADGTVVETIEGGIRNSSWHFFSTVPTPFDSSAEKNGCQNCKTSRGLSSEVELNSGVVTETHNLVGYTSLGVTRSLILTYDSLRADPRPIVNFGFENVDTNAITPGFADRLRLKAELSISRGEFQFEVPGYQGGQFGLDGGEHFWSIPAGEGPVRAALQAEMQDLETGRYDYSLSSGIYLFVRDQFVGTASTNLGEFIHVNSRSSEFGSGWGIAGLTEIIENPDGSILLVDGDGSELIFESPAQAGGAYISPPADFTELIRLADGRFQRTFKDQTVELYDENNRLSSVRDTNGNETQYQYNADQQISKIIDPVGLVTEFIYSDGRVSQIIDPTGRVTQLVHDLEGNLIQVIDPDDSARTWEYDTEHHMTSEVDQLGNREQAFYDFAGRASRAVGKDGSIIQVSPAQVQGLYRPELTTNPLSSPLTSTSDQHHATYADGNGNVTQTELDLAGQTISNIDGRGRSGNVQRNTQNLITTATDARGHETFFTYDDRGNRLGTEEQLTANSSTTFIRPNSSLQFDGVNDAVNLGQTIGNFGSDDFTIESWIKTTASGNRTIFSKRPVCDNSNFWEIALLDGRVFIEVDQDSTGTNYFGLTGNQVINDDSWHHIAVVRDDENLSIFIDGQLDSSQDGPGIVALSNGSSLLVGEGPCPGVDSREEFEGLIDEVRIWGQALTEADITSNMNQTLTGDEANLSGYWRFDEGTGTVLRDLSGNNNGILLNGASWSLENPTLQGYSFRPNELVYAEDFENGAGPEWSSSSTDNSYSDSFTRFSGRYNNDSQTLSLLTTPGENYALTFDLYAIDAWDGNSLPNNSDAFVVDIDGITVFNEPISANPTFSFREADLVGSLGFNDQYDDSIFRDITITFTATDANTEIRFADSGQVQGLLDQSWGIDNVEISSLTEDVLEVGVNQFTYDPTFNQLTSATDELGHQTLYEIDAVTGNVLSMTQVVGEVGGEDDLVTRYTYTAQGLTDLMTDPLGRVTDYDYDSLGQLVKITEALGTIDVATLQFEYDAAGNQSAVIDENGNRTAYEYDTLNRLIQITEADPDGDGPIGAPITQFTYDSRGNLLTLTDARNHTTQYEYDSKDRLIASIDPLQGRMIYDYDAAGNIVALHDELGHTTRYAYDSRNRRIETIDPEGYSTRLLYDADNNLTQVVDANGNATSYEYDARDRLINQIDALGGVLSYSYDAANNLVAQNDENGSISRFAYDDLDRLITTTDAVDGVTTTVYDKVGNVLALTDELGRTTQFDYDNRDRLTQITDPLDGVTTFAYDGVGNLLSVTDELNRTTTNEYDALNRQISVSDPLNHTTTFGYDAVDNLVSVTDALGRVTQYEYDALNRESTRINALGDTHSYTYDAADNVVTVTDELGRTTTFTYDDRDLLITVTDPLGHTTTTEYDGVGNVTAVIDALGHTTRYGYDALYRQTSETDAIGQTTTYAYDPVGNLLRITDPENNSTTYTYDALYRQVTDTNELGDTRRYAYDAVDNLIGMTDRNGRQFEYTYDGLDRQTEEIWLDAVGNPIRTFSYTYDAADQVTTVSDPDSAYTYTYDLAGRLITVDNAGTPGVPNVLLTYTYDAVNNMLTVTDTIEGQVSGLEEYTYDALDRVTQITQSGNGVAEKRVDFAYDVASQMTGSTRYADLAGTQLVAQSDYTFDLAGRLTNLTHSRDSVVIADYRWDYDAANRIIRSTSPDGTSDYNYDDRNQITGSDHSYQDDEAYTYDNNGNRTNAGYETGDNNRLRSDGTYTYTYDAEGNRITRTEIATGETTEYTWDYRNRLTEVVTKDSAGNVIQDVEYGYDVYDRRIEKTVDPDGDGPESEQTERFVYDGDHITLVFDENGEQTHRYLHGPQIDQVLAEEVANGEVRWALADNQGTVRDVIDSDGNVLNHVTYDSFGQITSETISDTDFRFGYTGREFDEETGQYYYRARYYDASVGRFISEDTVGFSAGDTNLYRYVFNNSTNYTDPSGNFALIPFLLFTAGTIILADLIMPDGVHAPTLDCNTYQSLDRSNERAVVEILLSLGLSAGPKVAGSALSKVGPAVDDLLRAAPSLGPELVPVEGVLRQTIDDAPKLINNIRPGSVTQGIAGKHGIEAAQPLMSTGQSSNNTPQVLKNKAQGDAFEAKVKKDFEVDHTGVQEQVTIKTKSGTRTRVDLIGNDKNGDIVIVEAKSSQTARLTKNQKKAFPEISKTGGEVVGKGKPGFAGGTQIPPTTIKIVRP